MRFRVDISGKIRNDYISLVIYTSSPKRVEWLRQWSARNKLSDSVEMIHNER